MLSGTYSITIHVTITLNFARETGSAGGGVIPVTFTVGSAFVRTSPGMTVGAALNFTWVGTNQITITAVRFSGAAASWITLAETLPKAVTKDVGGREGHGEVSISVLVPSSTQPGEYTVPATADAEAAGTRLTTGGWITFTVVKPATPTIVPDIMTYVIALILLALVAYAYLKR
jgi:hypothetical protein